MPDDMVARMLVALGLVIGLMGLLAWLLKKYGSRMGIPMLLKQGKARVQMLEITPLDARHRLVLIRRDDTEHLLLLGGAQPVVVETGIAPSSNLAHETSP